MLNEAAVDREHPCALSAPAHPTRKSSSSMAAALTPASRWRGLDAISSLNAPRGRALQMNAGAAHASGDALVFVHADTIVPATFARDIEAALADPEVVGGRFDVRLDDDHPMCVLIGGLISLRSRISRTGTGDQAIFVRKEIFESLGGFPDIPICEDLDFARRLKRAGRVACLRSKVTTSARRWRKGGIMRTVLRMWTIRSLYLMGVPPARLARIYSDVS